MRRRRHAVRRGGKPAWFLAVTLPDRIPRCTDCGQPAIHKSNRVARVLERGVRPDEADWVIGYRHRRCDDAPVEVPLPCDDPSMIGRVITDGRTRYLVTAVAHDGEGARDDPCAWHVRGVPEWIRD